MIEAMTYRWGQHSLRVNLQDPRPKDEVDSWLARDPLKQMESRLKSDKVLSKKQINAISDAVDTEIEGAVSFALNSESRYASDA